MTSKQQQQQPAGAEELDDDALLADLDDLDLHDMIIDDDSSEEGGITTSDLENSGLRAYENHQDTDDVVAGTDFQQSSSTYETTNGSSSSRKHPTSAASTVNSSTHYSSARGGYTSGEGASVFSAEQAANQSQTAALRSEDIHTAGNNERSKTMIVDNNKGNRGTSVTSVVTKHPDYVAAQAQAASSSSRPQSQIIADAAGGNDNNGGIVDGENDNDISIDIATLRHPQDFYNLGAKLLEKSRTEGAAKSAAVARANYLKYMNGSSSGGSSAKNRRSVVPP
eukprot:CAMPEP_0196801862 /NCGR_PEP_ID=MMETSP1362-20130617/1642_1 /TAXON_ID=163516 /ORGANISM="Leptocylindrus danicus, Strain CCMP1856" /LENGTH=280 /DNA_ID=CAMNT_0042173027 /DNA_START=36 /DNA_END=878 /DNA_ORIENTATION=+